jgi:hypothetical protein
MAKEEKKGTVTEAPERVTLYAWAESLGERERKALAAMPDDFKEAAAKALKTFKLARSRKIKLAEMVGKLADKHVEADASARSAESVLNRYADRIRAVVKAASLPLEEEVK